MRSHEEKFEKVLSILDVNVFELMDLTIETLGHQLIHESGVKTLKKKLSSIDLSHRRELYAKLGLLLSSQLTVSNYIEYVEIFRFASVLHCILPYEQSRTEEHSGYFDQLVSFDLKQISEDDVAKYKHMRGYEHYDLNTSTAFHAIYSNLELWRKFYKDRYEVYKNHNAIITDQFSLPQGHYLTTTSLENYFKTQMRKIEGDLIGGNYYDEMIQQLENIYISTAFDKDFIIDLSLDLLFEVLETEKNHHCLHESVSWSSDYLQRGTPLSHFLMTSESFKKKLIRSLTNGLISGRAETKRFIKRNLELLEEIDGFASILNQYEASISDDLDRDINHMTKSSDFDKTLSNFDVALMVATQSYRLNRIASKNPKDAVKQRQQFLYGLIKDNNPFRASQRPVDYQLQSRFYNYFVYQTQLDYLYRGKKRPIPDYRRHSSDPFNIIISDKEIEYSDYYFDSDQQGFRYIFEVIQRFINEKNKDVHEVWN